MRLSTACLAMFVLSAAFNAEAATFIVPSDAEMVRQAPLIVVGTAGGSEAFVQKGEIYTRTELAVHEVIRGAVSPGATLDIVGMGGVLGDRFVTVSGVPTFVPGERVLLFLTRNDHGQWAVQNWVLGKFTFVQSAGDRFLVRGVGSEHVFGWTPEGRLHEEALRRTDEFLEFVRGTARNIRQIAETSYSTAGDADALLSSSTFELENSAEPNAYLTTVFFNGQNIGFRWRQFDNGNSVGYRRNGAQPGMSAGQTEASVDRALAAWVNEPSTPVSLVQAGTTSAGFTINDGVNAIVFNQPFPSEAGGAIGFARWSGGEIYSRNGSTFIATTEGDVIVRDSVSGATLLDEVITHEVGHTLGFRHSNEGDPSSTDAIMRSSASGSRGANLGSWDIEALQAVYGTGASTCAAPAVTSQPQSTTVTSGGSTTLTVSASGTAPLTYAWFRATDGGFSQITGASNASLNTGSLSTTTRFFARITNACGTVDSAVATVTVQAACNAPVITAQPQSQSIAAGQSASLTVEAAGDAPLSYQWFQRTGTGGSFSQIGGATASTFQTPALSQTMQYFVRVTNACGSIESSIATITVQQACEPPQITQQPQDRALPAGGGQVTLTLSASGSSPLTVTWFRQSTAGNTVVGSGAQITVNQAGSYFATVANGCGSVDTRLVTVTAGQCDPITIIVQPQSQQVISGGSVTLNVQHSGTGPFTYQWYRGNVGDTSQPVATGQSFNTGALSATTSYWVRVSNCAGSVNSQAAVVTVVSACTAPAITAQPQGQSIRSGATATLSVGATGTALTYQWYQGPMNDTSKPVAGATSNTFTTPALRATTSYWVRVTNSCGAVSSSTATVTVTPAKRRGVRRG